MFRVNETLHGRGTLTVSGGNMSIHVSLRGKGIVNLYAGKADDAKNNKALWLAPSVDVVTYDDGEQEEVNGFDIPVPVLGEEFDVAILGKKDVWYDHKVSVDVAGE